MSVSESIRILLVDDHKLFRSGIRSLLQLYPEFDIIGEAGDGMEGVKRSVQLQPDVVLLDLHMPGLTGVESARLIKEAAPDIQVLVLTVSEEGDDLLQALRAGACGYLLKNIEADTLVSAIRAAAAGESVVSPQMLGKLIDSVREGSEAAQGAGTGPRAQPAGGGAGSSGSAAGEGSAGLAGLTPREREILAFIARGASNKEVARTLALAESTVKIHVQNLLRKLGLNSRVQAAVWAVEHGLGG